jgi:hypothetical protein
VISLEKENPVDSYAKIFRYALPFKNIVEEAKKIIQGIVDWK